MTAWEHDHCSTWVCFKAVIDLSFGGFGVLSSVAVLGTLPPEVKYDDRGTRTRIPLKQLRPLEKAECDGTGLSYTSAYNVTRQRNSSLFSQPNTVTFPEIVSSREVRFWEKGLRLFPSKPSQNAKSTGIEHQQTRFLTSNDRSISLRPVWGVGGLYHLWVIIRSGSIRIPFNYLKGLQVLWTGSAGHINDLRDRPTRFWKTHGFGYPYQWKYL